MAVIDSSLFQGTRRPLWLCPCSVPQQPKLPTIAQKGKSLLSTYCIAMSWNGVTGQSQPSVFQLSSGLTLIGHLKGVSLLPQAAIWDSGVAHASYLRPAGVVMLWYIFSGSLWTSEKLWTPEVSSCQTWVCLPLPIISSMAVFNAYMHMYAYACL